MTEEKEGRYITTELISEDIKKQKAIDSEFHILISTKIFTPVGEKMICYETELFSN